MRFEDSGTTQLQSTERRLAAIMFTDIVGYTALTQTNEAQALDALERHNRLLRPFFSKHKGKVIKTIGDSFLVEFESALDAAKCGIEIQEFLHDYDVSPEEWKIRLRIGIHLGDVVRREGDIFGDAVNIASRIQPPADPEGVCVSEQVYYQIRNKISYSFEQLDRPELKNVKFPTIVYKVIMLWQKQQNDQESALEKVSSLDKKRIAVLPFSNISPDPNDEYFADGMTEELISTIAKIAGLQVIARTSTLRYKSGNMSVVEIGRELKAGTILEGSVRKAGDKLRITAQLIDSEGSQHLWSESYDRELKDVFAIQSDISKTVANALKVQLLSSEKRDIEKRATESTEAHTMYLKGLHHYNERTKEGNQRAVKHFEEAIKLDPKYAIAYAALADCYSIFGDYGWLNPVQAYPKAKLFAAKAIETDPTLAEAHASLGLALSSDWNLIGAEMEYKKAIELKPGYATAYLRYGLLLEFMRRFEEAFNNVSHASKLDPLSRGIGMNLGLSLLFLGKRGQAIEQFNQVIELYPEYQQVHAYLGLTYLTDSRFEGAIEELTKAVTLSGGDPELKTQLGFAFGISGRKEDANKILNEIMEIKKHVYVSPVWMAALFFGLGRIDEAFEWLEKGLEEHSDQLFYFRMFPWVEEFRTDQRWKSIEKRMGC